MPGRKGDKGDAVGLSVRGKDRKYQICLVVESIKHLNIVYTDTYVLLRWVSITNVIIFSLSLSGTSGSSGPAWTSRKSSWAKRSKFPIWAFYFSNLPF